MESLTQDDLRQLTRLLSEHPDFANPRDCRRLLQAALAGNERGQRLLTRLDLEGAPFGRAVEVAHTLHDFGQVVPGKHVLGVLLNFLESTLGEEDARFARRLVDDYRLDTALAPVLPIDRWRGTDTPDALREKIIGENTLRDIAMLECALHAAAAVVRLRVEHAGHAWVGSGFLIMPRAVMSNHHVIAERAQLAGVECWFNYQLDVDGRPCEPSVLRADPGGCFHADPQLDYAVFELADDAPAAALAFSREIPRVDERVAIIQHPGGHYKKISMQNNLVAYADARVLQYTTSTEPGSSGSPIFDEGFRVVGIHHSGGMLRDPASGVKVLRNAGTASTALLADLHRQWPDLRGELQVR